MRVGYILLKPGVSTLYGHSTHVRFLAHSADVLSATPYARFTRPHTDIGLHHIAPLLRGQCVRVAPPITAVPTYPAIPGADFTRAIAECLEVDLEGQQRDNISLVVTVISHIDTVISPSSSISMLPSSTSILCA